MGRYNYPKYKKYSPAEIRDIRQTLGDSRSRFADRFLYLSFEIIKKWEEGKREPYGPAMVILQQLEVVAEGIKALRMVNV